MENKDATVSPYKASVLVTGWLESDGERPGVLAQMMYQYVANERIPAHKDQKGHWKIRMEDLEAWYENYLQRRRERVTSRD